MIIGIKSIFYFKIFGFNFVIGWSSNIGYRLFIFLFIKGYNSFFFLKFIGELKDDVL